jgi:hypothetical protein
VNTCKEIIPLCNFLIKEIFSDKYIMNNSVSLDSSASTEVTENCSFISAKNCSMDKTYMTTVMSSDNIDVESINRNTCCGLSVLSSHSLDINKKDYSYKVIGGFNEPTWMIDSRIGTFYAQNTFISGKTRFAELFENKKKGIISPGRILQLDNGKIRLANNGEIGSLVSSPYNAFTSGDPIEWHGKYLTDEFGQEIEINPDFNSKLNYVKRSERANEWTTCVTTGIVILEQDGSITSETRYIISANSGYAKASTRMTNIKLISVINDSFVKARITDQFIKQEISIECCAEGRILLGNNPKLDCIKIKNDRLIVYKNTDVKFSFSPNIVEIRNSKISFKLNTKSIHLQSGVYELFTDADECSITIRY